MYIWNKAVSVSDINKAMNNTLVTPDATANVWVSKNGTVQQNINKVLDMAGGIEAYINPTDFVVLKCNGQWPKQGYTNTECIKYVIDAILAIPSFSGEIYICDNIQNASLDGTRGFDATAGANRVNNWADYNWTTLAAYYQGLGKSVAIKQWVNGSLSGSELDAGITTPAEGEGWVRTFMTFEGENVYLSYPIFESPLTAGTLIDMKHGVWTGGAGGSYTGQAVKTIFMPTLNNHGNGSQDYSGVTSAIKCFFGATEIHTGDDNTVTHDGTTYHHIHSATYTSSNALLAGQLAAYYIQNLYVQYAVLLLVD